MLLQHVRKDLQGKALLLAALLAPLLWLHLGVGQVGVVVLVVCGGDEQGETTFTLAACHSETSHTFTEAVGTSAGGKQALLLPH